MASIVCKRCIYMFPLLRYLHLCLQGTDSEDETSLSEDSDRKNPWRNLATGGDAYMQHMQEEKG